MSGADFTDYYKKDSSEALDDFGSNEFGLSKGEAEKRLLSYGPNKLPEVKADSLVRIFLRQFQSPLIFILILAAVIVFLTGEIIDGFVILFVLFFNSIVGTFQEGRAQNIFSALKNFVKTDAVVVRDGEEYIVSDEEIVPGDVVIVREGGKIPADARLLDCDSLQVDESALTGESNPKFKFTDPIIKGTVSFVDQGNMIFKGTGIVSGSGKAVVTATGADTFIGNIAERMRGIDEELPLKASIRRLSRFIILAVILISIFIFTIGLFYGHLLENVFATIVAISVSIIPEGLPIVVTLVLATGVWRMGKQNVLVKRLQAVEALGQTNIIAVDKTGTVTKNELTVKEVYTGGNFFSVKANGYEPKGEIELNGKIIEPLNHPELLVAGKISALCSNSSLAFDNKSGKWKVSGDPTEAATLVFAEKIGFRKDSIKHEFEKIAEKPFDYNLKYHAVLYRQAGKNILYAIGAPEEILESSARIMHHSKSSALTSEEKVELKEIFLNMSESGLRVIALGMRDIEKNSRIPDKLDQLDFIGFFGIEDSPRDEVRNAVDRVQSAGIKLVMITGDHEITAKAIAHKIGIFNGERVLNGKEIDVMTEEELSDCLDDVSVFARVSPSHKLKIINAYKLAGKTVAMTGDGINDALSLTSADVGVAMGKIGTEVAREAADIILLDDNFGSIVSGVEEGRNIYRTIKRVILYLFSTSLGEVFVVLGAIFLGLPLPILAVQILWLNLVTDGFLDMALAMEPKEKGLLEKRFTKKQISLVDGIMIKRMFLMAIPMAIGTLFLFNRYQNDLMKAWTVSLTALAIYQWFNAWNCRSETKSIFRLNPFSNYFLVGATIIVIVLHCVAIYHPFFQNVLHTVPLGIGEWVLIILVSFSIIATEEIRKLITRKE